MIKGGFYWTDDIPAKEAPHFIVVASDADPEGNALIIPISSVKYWENGCEKEYDKSCIVLPEDVLLPDGRKILTKKSFVRYQYAVEIKVEKLLHSALTKKYIYHTLISKELLERVQEGAKISDELVPMFRKYFDFF